MIHYGTPKVAFFECRISCLSLGTFWQKKEVRFPCQKRLQERGQYRLLRSKVHHPFLYNSLWYSSLSLFPRKNFQRKKSIFTHKRNRLKRRTSRESISQPFGVLLCHKLLEGGAEKILLSQSFFLCPEIRREDSLPRRKLAFLAKDKKRRTFPLLLVKLVIKCNFWTNLGFPILLIHSSK